MKLNYGLVIGFLVAVFSSPIISQAEQKVPPEIEIWRTLSKLPEPGKTTPPEIKKMMGTKITVAGFPMANEMGAKGEIKEFFITPIAGGCIHVPPPPPGFIIMVKVKPGKKLDIPMFDWVQVTGVIDMVKDKKDRNNFGYKLTAESGSVFAPKF